MSIHCTVDGISRLFDVSPLKNVRELLYEAGYLGVRDSDNGEGFCGSDTILLDGIPVYANLLVAGEIEGCTVETPNGLGHSDNLTVVQKAMIDAGHYGVEAGEGFYTYPHPAYEDPNFLKE